MNQQVKQQWIDALRSGTYQQCTGELRNGSDEYCVLGVLCDLHSQAEDHGQGWQQIGKRWAWFYRLKHAFPSDDVCEWAEVDGDTLLNLEYMNDSKEDSKTFRELADYIDANL